MSWDADTYSISASLVDFSKISGYVIPFSNSGITSQFSGLSSAFEEQLSRDELSDAVLSKLFLLLLDLILSVLVLETKTQK